MLSVKDVLEDLRNGELNDIYPFESNSDYGIDSNLLSWINRALRKVTADAPQYLRTYTYQLIGSPADYDLPEDYILPQSFKLENGTKIVVNNNERDYHVTLTTDTLYVPFSYEGKMMMKYFAIHPKVNNYDDEVFIREKALLYFLFS